MQNISKKKINSKLVNMPYSKNYGIIKKSKGIISEGNVDLPFEMDIEYNF